jgi:FkbM family methyltransferase
VTPTASARRAVRSLLRRAGLDLVRYPPRTDEQSHLTALFDALGVTCVLDVGAHVGNYAGGLRDLGYEGRIVSFEPVESNAGALRERIDERWIVVQAALGAESGRRAIKLAAGGQQHSFLAPSEYGTRILATVMATVGEEEVDVIRLDDVFGEYVRPGEQVFLKLDTQGWDGEALRGAERSLDSIAALQVELPLQRTYDGQPDYLELLGWLRERAFEPTGVFPFLSDPDLLLVEADCICRRRS